MYIYVYIYLYIYAHLYCTVASKPIDWQNNLEGRSMTIVILC